MNESLLSVIIPVYKVEKYLERCVRSVLSQRYRNIELILIDDGSPDKSGAMCDEFAKEDGRIRVIHKENGGQASARNRGLEIARGEYIAFLDSDDFIDADMYADLISIIEKENCDIAACAIKRVDEAGTAIASNTQYDNSITFYNKEQMIEGLYMQQYVRFELWDKVYKRAVVQGVRLIEGQLYEEVNFDRVVFQRVEKYAFFNKPMHYYVTDRAGNTNSYFSERKLCIFEELDKFIHDIKEAGMPEATAQKFEAKQCQFCISLSVFAQKFKASASAKKFLREKARELTRKIKGNPFAPKKRMRLLCLSPALYYVCFNVKDRLKKQ
ncbi:MAG: glycosyltransferase family 2 protein [Clostridia bacterium]|nr:glycosyltransferase family 2 protein [Clostridia bacterium]